MTGCSGGRLPRFGVLLYVFNRTANVSFATMRAKFRVVCSRCYEEAGHVIRHIARVDLVSRQGWILVGNKPIFDPVNRTLQDARGDILKHVNCPRLKSWQQLVPVGSRGVGQRLCDSCDKAVLDTAQMTPEEIVRAAHDDPEVCFRIRLGQDNIEIKVSNGQ